MNKALAQYILPTLLVFLFSFQTADNYEPKESTILHSIMTYLDRMHFIPVEIDDEFSEMVFDHFFERLDPNKRILLNDEIQSLENYRYLLDDEIRARTFDFFDRAATIVDEANERAERIYSEVIDSDFDFEDDEYIETDVEKLAFCDDEAELRERWRRVIKLQIMKDISDRMNRAEEDSEEEEEASDEEEIADEMDFDVLTEKAVERIKKRMDRWFNQLLKARRVDRLSTYLNSITTLYDPHTGYFKPKDKEDFDMRMSNRLEGIGARLTQDGDYVKVVDIIPGGPAWKQGDLEVDDMIVKVAQEEDEPIDVVGWHINDVISKIRGKKGTKVRLFVKKVDNREEEIEIIRDIIVFDDGYVRSFILENEQYKDRIGYINLPSFYFDSGQLGGRSSSKDVKEELKKLQDENVDGIVFDLRNNGGGSLRDVVEMSGYFIEKGPIVQVKSRDVSPHVLTDKNSNVSYDGPLIVLTNQGSASASEIFAAAMQDYGRAVIVGSPTFGKGTVQRFFDLDKSLKGQPEYKPLGEVKITTQKFYRVNGDATQLKGVQPNIFLPDPYQHFSRGERDYDHAMEWSSIDKTDYQQNVYHIENLSRLQERSQARVERNATFQKINEYSEILKKNRDLTIFPLDFEAFYDEEEALEDQMKKYKDLYPKIDHLSVDNLASDIEDIQSDSTKIERNDRFLKNIVKDAELEEATAIMNDMIRMNRGQALRLESDH